jgi:hypothetical protein
MLEPYRDKYADFTVKHFHEHLVRPLLLPCSTFLQH